MKSYEVLFRGLETLFISRSVTIFGVVCVPRGLIASNRGASAVAIAIPIGVLVPVRGVFSTGPICRTVAVVV